MGTDDISPPICVCRVWRVWCGVRGARQTAGGRAPQPASPHPQRSVASAGQWQVVQMNEATR
eukprot:6097722-Alexandrium_andersonii.AAC.1